MMHVIETQNLTKYYGKARGIIDLSLQVKAGEIFGFIGPNGAGKSTTIRLLLSLIFPSSGSARIFGKDVFADGPEIRQEIGYLPSEVFYYEGMKVIDLLTYSASFYAKKDPQRMRELADIMQLDLNRRIEDLSYGNKKKVGIVQGLQHRPKLLFLDEPTSGLDPLMQRTFFQLLREENEQHGVSIFFSSHILSEVQRLCDRVGIIKEGRLIEISDIRAMRQDRYKKITVTGAGLKSAQFALPGVTQLESSAEGIRFFYKGNINTILRQLARLEMTDVTIEEPTLEEIFMNYYQ
jgi:ABC-2 type transport system ATP-binding protein